MSNEIFNEREERVRTECYELVKYRDRSQLMTFISRDDSRHSFGYDSLYGAHFHGQTIRVEFTRNTVVVDGENLASLHRAMADHRIVFVRERPEGLVIQFGEPSVEKIAILEVSDLNASEKKSSEDESSSANQTNHPKEKP